MSLPSLQHTYKSVSANYNTIPAAERRHLDPFVSGIHKCHFHNWPISTVFRGPILCIVVVVIQKCPPGLLGGQSLSLSLTLTLPPVSQSVSSLFSALLLWHTKKRNGSQVQPPVEKEKNGSGVEPCRVEPLHKRAVEKGQYRVAKATHYCPTGEGTRGTGVPTVASMWCLFSVRPLLASTQSNSAVLILNVQATF